MITPLSASGQWAGLAALEAQHERSGWHGRNDYGEG